MELFETPEIRKVYLAGPMSGFAANNAPAFNEAAEALRKAGLEVIHPVEMDEEQGFDHDASQLSEEDYNRFLGSDIIRMLSEDVDALVVLSDWEESRGVALEVHVARELGKLVYAYPSGERLKRPTDYRPPSDESILEEADRLISTQKGPAYGHPLDDFARTAKMWTALLLDLLKEGVEVPTERVPLMMIATRMSRQVNNPRRSNYVHMAGFARTGEMVTEELERRKIDGEEPAEPESSE